jgi:hypothetical protein
MRELTYQIASFKSVQTDTNMANEEVNNNNGGCISDIVAALLLVVAGLLAPPPAIFADATTVMLAYIYRITDLDIMM